MHPFGHVVGDADATVAGTTAKVGEGTLDELAEHASFKKHRFLQAEQRLKVNGCKLLANSLGDALNASAHKASSP